MRSTDLDTAGPFVLDLGMLTERQAIDKLRRQVEFNRHQGDRQAEETLVSLSLDAARVIVNAWDERNPHPPPYPAPV